MNNYREQIPVLVRALRGDDTLKVFSEKSGVSVSYLSDIENGRTIPSIEMLEKIAGAVGVSLLISVGEDDNVFQDYVLVEKKKLRQLVELVSEIEG